MTRPSTDVPGAVPEPSRPSAELTIDSIMIVGHRRFLDRLPSSARDQRAPHVGATSNVDEPTSSLVEVVSRRRSRFGGGHPRAAFVFRYIDDLSTTEVAALLDRAWRPTDTLLARAHEAGPTWSRPTSSRRSNRLEASRTSPICSPHDETAGGPVDRVRSFAALADTVPAPRRRLPQATTRWSQHRWRWSSLQQHRRRSRVQPQRTYRGERRLPARQSPSAGLGGRHANRYDPTDPAPDGASFVTRPRTASQRRRAASRTTEPSPRSARVRRWTRAAARGRGGSAATGDPGACARSRRRVTGSGSTR